MKKSYFFGFLFLLYIQYGFSQNCAAGFTLSSNVSSVCSGDAVVITLSGSQSGYSYEIISGGSVLDAVSGNNNPISFTVNPTTQTTYDVKVVGCSNPYDSITIDIIPTPNITLSSAAA
ncbi:hypothetical protein, partial [Flavobacterium limnosediminis]|uniref:hypothetical protein n=1 Tax=Flavobacterium limnosediminis TaxID=1401027 RepID=UPI00055861FA